MNEPVRVHAGYQFNVTCLDCGGPIRHRTTDIDPKSMLANADCAACGAQWDIDVVMTRRINVTRGELLIDPIEDWLACPHCGLEHAGLTRYRNCVASHQLIEEAV